MFNKYIIVVLLSAAGLLSAHRFGVSKSENGTSRIIGGVNTPIERAPYQLSLQVNGHHFCGGAIYSTYIIVTSSNCARKYYPSNIFVRVGSDAYNSGGFLIKVSSAAVHPHQMHSRNDIALLLLSSPLQLSNRVKTIELARSVPRDGATVMVSGWGQTKTECQPIKLQSALVNIIPLKQCMQAHNSNQLFKEVICTASPDKFNSIYDMGGPLVYGNQLVGIVSISVGCGQNPKLGVYANIATQRKWIVETANTLLKYRQ